MVDLQVEMSYRRCGSGIQMRDEMNFARDNEVFNFGQIPVGDVGEEI